MKLISFKASKVHGYLDFDVTFRSDVNFFAGLNGSGKTTALKLMVSMITPSINTIRDISFETSEIFLEEKNKKIRIKYNKKNDFIFLRVTINDESFSCCINEREEHRSKGNFILKAEIDDNEIDSVENVISKIHAITSPMFLSLDRRFIKASSTENKFRIHGFEHDYESIFSGIKNGDNDSTGDVSINEVLRLVSEEFKKARALQSDAENRLRDRIILDSFSFTDTNFEAKLPNRNALNELEKKQRLIIDTLENLDLSIDGFQSKFYDFFERFETLVKAIEANKKNNKKIDDAQQEAMVAWFINQNQLRRIERIFILVEEYQAVRKRIYKNLDKLKSIINGFLLETNKSIFIDSVGQIKVSIFGREASLSILSSGERQILIMFTHLVLEKTLRSGIFIVDEPELSLHISWQDMYVAAVQEANSGLQLILATHSPAIIGGRNDMYVPLDGGSK